MSFPVKDFRQIRADILRDIANKQPAASVGEDSDFALRAGATGAAIEGLYQHQQWIVRQIFPDTSDSDFLDQHAALRGIARKAATVATGTVLFSGVTGSAVPVGTECKTNDGIVFVTTVAGVIGIGGTVSIAARASVAAKTGNQASSTPLTLSAAPTGIQSQASIESMTGGTDIEADAELLARLLTHIRLPPAGGALHDYAAWAFEVAGVTDAYPFAQRRSANSVDVVIETSGGLPGLQLIADVQAHIDSMRPVGADVLVLAPTAVAVNIAATLTLASGTALIDTVARINEVLAAYFSSMQVGGSATRARLTALMMGVPGVLDVDLTEPASNAVALVDATHVQLLTLGTVALT